MRTTSRSADVLAQLRYGKVVFSSYEKVLSLFKYRLLPKMWIGEKSAYRSLLSKSEQIYEVCLDMVKNGDPDSCRTAAKIMDVMADEFAMVADGLDHNAAQMEYIDSEELWVSTPGYMIKWLDHALPELQSMWT